ncbi:MAG: hypothetical protein ACR2KL_12845 [Nocardioidaceae bacterium]
MRIRASLWTALVIALGSCSSNSAAGPQAQSPAPQSPAGSSFTLVQGVGFGESLNIPGGGHQRVDDLVDPARSSSSEPAAGDRLVRALVEECAPADAALRVTSRHWYVRLNTHRLVPTWGPVRSAPQGAQPLPRSRSLRPGSCAFVDLQFQVPTSAQLEAVVYRHAGQAPAAWIVP